MASILEVFGIILTLDASKAKEGAKGAEDAMKGVKKAIKEVSVEGEIQEKVLKKLTNRYGLLIGAIGGVASILYGMFKGSHYAKELNDMSKSLDISIEDLSAWGDVVRKNGGTAEGFYESVKSMTTALAEFSNTGSNKTEMFFQGLGIQMTDAQNKARSFMEILPEIADRFQGLSKEESFGYGRGLGLDDGTISILQKGRKEIELLIQRQKELGVVTTKDAEAATKFYNALDDTSHAFRSFSIAVGSSVLPAITAVLKGLESIGLFLKENSGFITGLLIGLGVVILTFVVPPLYAAAAAAIALQWPLILIATLIGALVVGFALLYDDIKNFAQGNDSVLGRMIEKWPFLGKIIFGIIRAFKEFFTSVKIIFGVVKDAINSVEAAIEKMVQSIRNAIRYVMNLIGPISELFGKVKSFFKDTEGKGTKSISDKIQENGGGTLATNNITKARNAISFSAKNKIPGNSLSNIVNNKSGSTNTTQVDVENITINTQATDASGIAAGIGDAMKNQMRQTSSNLDDGVAA